MAEISVDQAADREFYTVNEAASILGVHPITVRKMTSSGELPSFKVSGRRFVHRTVLDAIRVCARSGDPDPVKTVREQLAAKYPEFAGGVVEAKA